MPTLRFHLAPDFVDLLSAFHAHGVRYLIVGGYAFGAYVQPRATKDLDIFILSDAANAQAVFNALAAFGAPMADLSPADFSDGKTVFQIGQPPLRVDVL